MAIDLKTIKPNKVSKDISSYVTLIFGAPKIGKSRLAAEFPKPIFFATEPTQETIPGAYIAPTLTWRDFKSAVRQLKNDDIKQAFNTVVIDTIDLAASYCEKYICNQQGVESIKDIPYGAGYGMVENEFRDTLYSIKNAGYGIVMISHVANGTFTREDGTEFNERTPTIPGKRTKGVAENLADIYGFIHMAKDEENGGYKRVISLRAEDPSTPNGNHFKYIPSQVDLSYEALNQALAYAIDKEEAEMGQKFFQEEKKAPVQTEELNFEELMNTFNTLVHKLQEISGGSFGSKWAPIIAETVAKYLGKGKKISECGPDQIEQVALIVDDLVELVGNGI